MTPHTLLMERLTFRLGFGSPLVWARYASHYAEPALPAALREQQIVEYTLGVPCRIRRSA